MIEKCFYNVQMQCTSRIITLISQVFCKVASVDKKQVKTSEQLNDAQAAWFNVPKKQEVKTKNSLYGVKN